MPKMSSDIDEEEDYSSIDERDPKVDFRARQQQMQQQQQQMQMQAGEAGMEGPAPAYVNLNDPKLTLDLNGEGSLRSGARREKNR